MVLVDQLFVGGLDLIQGHQRRGGIAGASPVPVKANHRVAITVADLNVTPQSGAIAIPADEEDPRQPLASYFERSVIGGSQAFVMSPKEPHDYVTALRRKLVTEVSMNIDTGVPAMETPALSAPIAEPQ